MAYFISMSETSFKPSEMVKPPVFSGIEAQLPKPPASDIRILPWQDPVTDAVSYDSRSLYVEMFWLPVLGPSCIWLIRRFALWLQKYPKGFELNTAVMAQELGLGTNSQKRPPLKRTLERCCDFNLAHLADSSSMFVKTRIPRLNDRLINRLTERLKQAHLIWTDTPESSKFNPSQEMDVMQTYFLPPTEKEQASREQEELEDRKQREPKRSP